MDGEPCNVDTYEGISLLIGKPRRMCFQAVDEAFMREVQSWICQALARIEEAERKRDDALRDKERLLSVIKLCEGEINSRNQCCNLWRIPCAMPCRYYRNPIQ